MYFSLCIVFLLSFLLLYGTGEYSLISTMLRPCGVEISSSTGTKMKRMTMVGAKGMK